MAAISVIGMGPGPMEYLLPAAAAAIEEAEVLFGAPRHIGPNRNISGVGGGRADREGRTDSGGQTEREGRTDKWGQTPEGATEGVRRGTRRGAENKRPAKECRELKSPFSEAMEEIAEVARTRKVAVLVSGDPCFYSYLGLLKKRFSSEELVVYPGISSFQVLMARTGTLWNNALVMSVHGRELSEVVDAYDRSPLVVLLTDPKNTPSAVAATLLKAGRTEGTAVVGRNLAYPHERIDTYTIPELAKPGGQRADPGTEQKADPGTEGPVETGTEDFGDDLCVMMLKRE